MNVIERYFGIDGRNTTIKTEILAGLTTFLTMAYIIFVNPDMLAKAGMDKGAVFVATCLASALGCFLMGLIARLPVALAPGMGLNAFFTFTVVLGMGKSWQVALGAVSPVTVEKFVKMIDIIRQNYVTNVDDESLFANAMAGTLAALDPYSEYLDENAFENLRLFTEGDIGSIGVSVSFHADVDSWVFDDVLPNSPAAKAGIQRGNYLHQINDNKLDSTRTSQDVDQLLTGIAGTTARLLVSDKGRRKHLVVVQRTLVQQQAMSTNIINGAAVVQIPVFQNNTQQQFLMALTKLNQPFSVLVLDLRNNPGGVLSAANDIASLFMNDKVVVEIKNRQGIQEVMRTHGKAQFADLPLVVLQNRYSASAAEVLASALQNNQRAKVYGETSYGKGSIQSIVPINDSEAVKLTVAHYYSSKGEKIDGVGVKPDVTLTGAETSWQDQVLADLQTTKRSNQFLLKPTPTPQSF